MSKETVPGYIKIHRKIMEWEWYKSPSTGYLFIFLILSANFAEQRFMGKKIKRGQFVTSLATIAQKTGLSVQQVRTGIKHLISTNEITNDSYRTYRIITVVNYDEYQMSTKELTNEQQTANKPLTNEQQQYKNTKNTKKGRNIDSGTASRFTPPTADEIDIFCRENGIRIDVGRFIDHYTANGWMVGKNHMKDWRATVRNWARRDGNMAQASEDDGLDCWGKPIRKEFE